METLKFTVTVVAILVLTISFTWWVAQEHFRNSMLDMRAKMFAAETQLKIEIENSRIKLGIKDGIVLNLDNIIATHEQLQREYNIGISRQAKHIEQLCKVSDTKDDEIFLLLEDKKNLQTKLDHYRPLQGEKGRFVKKSLQTT